MRPLIRRRTVFGPIALATLGAIAAIASPLGATGSSSVEPRLVAGTPTCSSDESHSFKIDNINESQLKGTWTATSAGVEAKPTSGLWQGARFTITAVSTGDHTFSWSAAEDEDPLDVASVIVKGGPNANVYSYDDEASSDSGLHAPVNKGKRYFSISQIVFCISPAKPKGDDCDKDGYHQSGRGRDDDGCRPDDVCPKDESDHGDDKRWQQTHSWGDGERWGDAKDKWREDDDGEDGDDHGKDRDDDGKDRGDHGKDRDECKPPPPPPTTTTTTTTTPTTPKPPPPPPSKVCPAGTPYSFTIAGVRESQLAGDYTSTTAGVAVEPSGDAFWTGVKFTISGVDTTAHTFNWSAARDSQPLGVDHVIVRGKQSALLYTYIPEVSSATGLHAPRWTQPAAQSATARSATARSAKARSGKQRGRKQSRKQGRKRGANHGSGHGNKHGKGGHGKKHDKGGHGKKHDKGGHGGKGKPGSKHGFQKIKSITFCLDKEDQPPEPPPTTTTTTTTTPTTTTTTVTTPPTTTTTTVTTPPTTLTTTVTTTTPSQTVSAPPPTSGTTPPPTTPDVTPPTPRRGNATASISPGCLRKRSVRVSVRGTAMRRITFRLNGRTVKQVTVRSGQRVVRTTLTTDGSRVQRVTAVVSFGGSRTARTLRVTGFRCVRNTPPRFTG